MSLHGLIRSNQRKSLLLMLALGGVLLITGFAMGTLIYAMNWFSFGWFDHPEWDIWLGPGGMALALLIWLVSLPLSYFYGDRAILYFSEAQEVHAWEAPLLHQVLEEMLIASGQSSKPRLYLIPSGALNAFATGRGPEHASIVVTSGLLEALTREELQAVMAHELAHINNRDILYLMLASTLLGAVLMLSNHEDHSHDTEDNSGFRVRIRTDSDSKSSVSHPALAVLMLIILILAPLCAKALYFSLSRRREYLADACAALYTRYPEGLASALEKIQASTEPLGCSQEALAVHFITNPIEMDFQTGLADVTATHPPISERIRILRSLGSQLSLGRYQQVYQELTGQGLGLTASDLSSLPRRQALTPAAPDPRSARERHRDTTQILWLLNGYLKVNCHCGLRFQLPPDLKTARIQCPRCKRQHARPEANNTHQAV